MNPAAVSKPAGLLSVPGRGEDKTDSLASRVQAEYPDALVSHRLDRDTSGLLLFPRGADMHRRISLMFEKREMQKSYVACDGQAGAATGRGESAADRGLAQPPRQMVDAATGKPALTRYKVLSYDAASNTSRVGIGAITVAPPVAGCICRQRPPDSWRYPVWRQCRGRIERLLLHAHTLEFRHPVSGRASVFAASFRSK